MDQSYKENCKPLESEGHRLSIIENFSIIDIYNDKVEFSDRDINRLMELLSSKDSRLYANLGNSKQVLQKFRKKHMYENVYMRISIRKILYDLANDRKIGRNLKGLSKLLLEEVENKIWEILALEMKLFQKEDEIKKCQDIISKDVNELFPLAY